MKKITYLIFISYIIFPMFIKSDSFIEEIPENKKVNIIQSEKRYRWYKEKVEKQYEYIEDVEQRCEYFDENDFIYDDIKESINYPDFKVERIIEEKNKIIEINDGMFNYISLSNIGYSKLTILNLYLVDYYTKDLYPFEVYSCFKCSGDKNNLNDNNTNTYVDINPESIITLKIGDIKLSSDRFILKIGYKPNQTFYSFDTSYLVDNIYEIKRIKNYTFDITRVRKDYEWYYETSFNYGYFVTKNKFEEKYYEYQDKKIACYNTKKEYIDGYFSFLEGFIKDENSEKTFYKVEDISCNVNQTFQKENDLILENNLNKNDDKKIAINVSKNNDNKKNNKVIYIYITLLFVILSFLVLICLKLRKNIKNSR